MERNLFWYPVEKELPKDMDRILVTIHIGKRTVVRSATYYYGLFSVDNGDVWKTNEPGVIAWMSLPEPYKE